MKIENRTEAAIENRMELIGDQKAGGPHMWEMEYYEHLQKELERKGGENVDIAFREVQKNNGIRRKACTVRFDGAQIAPTVYLEQYYDHYLHGEAVSDSAENILRYCRKKTPAVSFPENFFRDFDTVRRRIGIKLIGRERNESFLRGVPHIDIEDLSAIFFYLLEDTSFGNGMIVIRNADLARWQMTTEQLYAEALRTCPLMLPGIFRPLSEILDILVYPSDYAAPQGELFLLTNQSALYGASVILYPGMLQKVADQIGGNYFILPSSVHEVILLPDNGEEPEGLLEIVTEINHTQVTEEEILADAVYHYTYGENRIVKMA